MQAQYTAFESMATSFMITAGVEDNEYYNFIARYKELSRGVYTSIYICKYL